MDPAVTAQRELVALTIGPLTQQFMKWLGCFDMSPVSHVARLEDGMLEWRLANLPVEAGA